MPRKKKHGNQAVPPSPIESSSSAPKPVESLATLSELAQVLRNADIEPRDRFFSWYLTPPLEREPKTQTELALLLDVDMSTIAKWKKDPEFCDLIPDGARRRAMNHASAVMEKLVEKALGGSTYAMELYFKFVLQLAEPEDRNRQPAVDNRTLILIGGKPADSLPVGLVRTG